MERLCERPGCSDRASVAYGMRAEDLVFWLDALSHDDGERRVLCRRHADTMVVPRGWTLDDLRDPDLHLFRPPAPTPVDRTRRPRSSRAGSLDETGEQLRLDDDVLRAVDRVADSGDDTRDLLTGADGAEEMSENVLAAGPWAPAFDEADDLDGLLSADSPLLSRAFRTADRSDR